MLTVILEDFRQYFELPESECKHYDLIEDKDFLFSQREILCSNTLDYLSKTELPVKQISIEGKWVVTDGIELDDCISLSEELLSIIPASLLICLKVDTGSYHILSELAKKWFLCTGNTCVPKKYYVKYN